MKILATTAGPVPAKEKAEYIVNIAKRLNTSVITLHILQGEDQKQGQAAILRLTAFLTLHTRSSLKVARQAS